MNDKWNPRLWLRSWLIKPSQAERSEQRTGQPAATQMTLEASAKQAGRTVGAGFVLLADRHEMTLGKESEPTFRLELSPSCRVEGIRIRR